MIGLFILCFAPMTERLVCLQKVQLLPDSITVEYDIIYEQ